MVGLLLSVIGPEDTQSFNKNWPYVQCAKHRPCISKQTL